MENVTSLGISQPFAAPNSGGIVPANEQRSAVQELLAPNEIPSVPLNEDIPATSQVDDVRNDPQQRTTQTNDAEPADQLAQEQTQQRQIETALSEITGRDADEFQGIELQTALDIQESFRNRPALETDQAEPFSPAPAAFDSPDASRDIEQPDQQLQERLQTRLADRIPNDPGTEFPQLIQTIV